MRREQFIKLVHLALRDLPAPFLEVLENVDIVVEDWPDQDLMEEMGLESKYDLFGLYRGTPLAERGDYQPLLPDYIVIFQRPLEAACETPEEVVKEVRKTLFHEIGHYLGMTEEELDRLGYG